MTNDLKTRIDTVLKRWSGAGARRVRAAVDRLVGARARPQPSQAFDPNDPGIGRTRLPTPVGPVTVYTDPRTNTIIGVSGPGSSFFPGVPEIPEPQRTMDPPPSMGPDDPMPEPADPMSGSGGSTPPSQPEGDYPDPPDPDAGGNVFARGGDVDPAPDGDAPDFSSTRRPRGGVVDPGPDPGIVPSRGGSVVARPPRDPGNVDPSPDGAPPDFSSVPRPRGGVVDPLDPFSSRRG